MIEPSLALAQGWERTPWVPHLLGKLGQHEVAGPKSNPFILDCYEVTIGTRGRAFDDSAIAWCSAAMNWAVVQCGIKGTGSLAARSWLTWGVETVAPFPGCIVVYWRDAPDSEHGHVGIWMAAHGGNILTLGGNERNQVSIEPYPAIRKLAYRQMALA